MRHDMTKTIPTNTRYWNNVGLMLGQRRRRCTNIKPILFQCVVFAGILYILLRKAKRQYMLTLQVSRYCLFALQSSAPHSWRNGALCHVCVHTRICTRITSWIQWDESEDTALQTPNLKFEPWWSEARYVTSRLRKLPTILKLYEWTTEHDNNRDDDKPASVGVYYHRAQKTS